MPLCPELAHSSLSGTGRIDPLATFVPPAAYDRFAPHIGRQDMLFHFLKADMRGRRPRAGKLVGRLNLNPVDIHGIDRRQVVAIVADLELGQ